MKPPSSLEKLIGPSILNIISFFIPLLYWVYLACTTQMLLQHDALGYEQLGRSLQEDGWMAYFQGGPNREPLYPLLVSVSMRLAALARFSYQSVLLLLQIGVLLLSQRLLFLILREVRVRPGITAGIIFYFGISPAVVNSALSLYSEIISYPLVLMIIYWSLLCLKEKALSPAGRLLFKGLTLGALLFLLTMAKAITEAVAPVFMLSLFTGKIFFDRAGSRQAFGRNTIMVGSGLIVFFVLISGYKFLNYRYNGSFSLTNRGAEALYGNTARRVDPSAVKRIPAALASIPGPEFCPALLKNNEDCFFWSAQKSDDLMDELAASPARQQMSRQQWNEYNFRLTKHLIVQNPVPYGIFWALEGVKMVFWDSVSIGFVVYPSWLRNFYSIPVIHLGLPFLSAFVAFFVLGYGLRYLFCGRDRQRKSLAVCVFAFWLPWVAAHNFFFVLPRYVLSLTPVYLVLIALALDEIIPRKRSRPA